MVHGPNNNASLNRIVIIRKTPDGQQHNIAVLLGNIMKAKSPDMTLHANNILYVPNGARKATAKAGAQAALALTLTSVSLLCRTIDGQRTKVLHFRVE